MSIIEPYLDQIKESTLQLLTCNEQVGLMKQLVDQLYKVYSSLSDVTINDQNDSNIFLPSGKAILPAEAAHRLLEPLGPSVINTNHNRNIGHNCIELFPAVIKEIGMTITV